MHVYQESIFDNEVKLFTKTKKRGKVRSAIWTESKEGNTTKGV